MKKFSDKDRQRIQNLLEERGAMMPCPRCGNRTFVLLDGYFNQSVQSGFKEMVFGGLSLPSVVVGCNRCGYLSHHALGALGLLPSEDIPAEETKE